MLNDYECSRKIASGMKVASVIKSLEQEKRPSLKSAWVMHENMLLSVLKYNRETQVWDKRCRCKRQFVKLGNLTRVLDDRRADKMVNANNSG